MPTAHASPQPADAFAQATAAPLPSHAASLLSPRIAHLPARNKRGPAPNALTQPPFVLVKRAQGFGHGCARTAALHQDAEESLPTSALVKRVGVLSVLLQRFLELRFSRVSVPETHHLAQRQEGHWRAFFHFPVRRLENWLPVARMLPEARQVVLVKSLSSHCRGTLVALCSRRKKAVLNCVGACCV